MEPSRRSMLQLVHFLCLPLCVVSNQSAPGSVVWLSLMVILRSMIKQSRRIDKIEWTDKNTELIMKSIMLKRSPPLYFNDSSVHVDLFCFDLLSSSARFKEVFKCFI